MNMTFNEAIARYNLTTNLLLKSGDAEITKEAKVKVIKNRISLGKAKKEWDEFMSAVATEITPDEFKTLAQKDNRTDEENAKLAELENKINDEFDTCAASKAAENVEVAFEMFTEDEFVDVINVNADNDVNINGQLINGPQFLELCYSLLVKS